MEIYLNFSWIVVVVADVVECRMAVVGTLASCSGECVCSVRCSGRTLIFHRGAFNHWMNEKEVSSMYLPYSTALQSADYTSAHARAVLHNSILANDETSVIYTFGLNVFEMETVSEPNWISVHKTFELFRWCWSENRTMQRSLVAVSWIVKRNTLYQDHHHQNHQIHSYLMVTSSFGRIFMH